MLRRSILKPFKLNNSRFSTIKQLNSPSFISLAHRYDDMIFNSTSKEKEKISNQSLLSKFIVTNCRQKLKKMQEKIQCCDSIDKMIEKESEEGMKELFQTELTSLNADLEDLNTELSDSYFEFQNEEINEVMIEIRAGTGGDEAAQFASELTDLYKLFFDFKGWNYNVLSESSIGSQTKEVILLTVGDSFSELFCETGVHRVQRVPSTDSQGRIHTSTVTVAIIPQLRSVTSDPDSLLNMKDVRMDVYRSSGPGGQNVNKTNSAVRLVHTPTGISVCMQDERSQIENKVRAIKVLKFRLEERARTLNQQSTKAIRQEQIGTGERSEKIRTYNFPQNRVTDHRIGYSYQNLPQFFKDPRILDDFIQQNKIQRLSNEIEMFQNDLLLKIKDLKNLKR